MKYIFLIITLLFIGCSQRDENIYVPSSASKSTPKLKPYKVLGRWYYPRYVNVGETFRGISSWYGPNFHGKLTANGEIYDMYALTAANKIMPMNTIIKVTNLDNQKSVIVRVNDRGPFVKDRILDLSYAAGKKIGLNKTGTAPVEIEVLSTPYQKNPKYSKSSKKTYKKVIKNGKIKIQIGAFSSYSRAKVFKNSFWFKNKQIIIKEIDNRYKVFVAYFKTYNEAKRFKNRYNIKGFIVK